MLSGEYNHNLDSKGRVIIPAKLREQLGETIIITKGLDNCLFVFPEKEWQNFQEKLSKLKLVSKEARSFIRFFIGSSEEISLDKSGRILLPHPLREYASIEKEAVLVGVLNRLEIWDKERWISQNEETCNNMENIALKMEEMGMDI